MSGIDYEGRPTSRNTPENCAEARQRGKSGMRVYERLAGDRMGLFGAVTNRAEAQTMRLAMMYALLDRSNIVEVEHLNAGAGGVVLLRGIRPVHFRRRTGRHHRRRGAESITGESGRNDQDEPKQVIRSEQSATEINRALTVLVEHGRIRCESEPTAGRKAERWFAVAEYERNEFNERSRTVSQ